MAEVKKPKRQKPDKWRNLLKEAEAQSAQKVAEVERLVQQQELLKGKQEVLNQICDALALIAQLLAEQKEHTLSDMLDMEVQIQACLFHVEGVDRRSTLTPESLEFLENIYNLDRVQEVLALSDEQIMERLRLAAGKCAILLVQNQASSAWQQPPKNNTSSSTLQLDSQPGPSSAARLYATQPSGSAAMMAAEAQGAVPSATIGISSLIRSDSSPAGDGSNHSSDGSRSSSMSNESQYGPAFELSTILGILFNWDLPRFMKLASLNLETGAELKLGELRNNKPGFGKWLANKLQLTGRQIATLKALRGLVQQDHELLPHTISQAVVQQQAIMQQQEQQQQQPEWAHSWPAATGQLQEAHEQVLQQHNTALRRFHLLAVYMGLVTLITLTPAQLAILNACSWPTIPRIEPILDVLDDITLAEKQQQQLDTKGSARVTGTTSNGGTAEEGR